MKPDLRLEAAPHATRWLYMLGAIIWSVGIMFTANPAGAQWLPDGNPVRTGQGYQSAPYPAADGSGGAFVVWTDVQPSGDPHVFCGRLTHPGVPAPGWPANGLQLSQYNSSHAV